MPKELHPNPVKLVGSKQYAIVPLPLRGCNSSSSIVDIVCRDGCRMTCFLVSPDKTRQGQVFGNSPFKSVSLAFSRAGQVGCILSYDVHLLESVQVFQMAR